MTHIWVRVLSLITAMWHKQRNLSNVLAVLAEGQTKHYVKLGLCIVHLLGSNSASLFFCLLAKTLSQLWSLLYEYDFSLIKNTGGLSAP